MKTTFNEYRLKIVRTTMPAKPAKPKPTSGKGGGCNCGGKGK